GARLIFFASGDYKNTIDFAAIIDGSKIEQFDVKRKAWANVEPQVAIHLEPGAATLFRVKREKK
ncbi:MAG TPA: hypothetical protein VL282_06810, partial [Tepidisphaeraceae bacterium]|nr:hypothetical protein [Tepidisphaeraceae bacterium]